MQVMDSSACHVTIRNTKHQLQENSW